MGEWLDFTAIQWACIAFSFVVVAVATERTLASAKRESIGAILDFLREDGVCEQCVAREKKRLEKSGYATVETERIMREKSGFMRV